MNIFEKVAEEFSKWSKAKPAAVDHDEPNRHERRIEDSRRKKFFRKFAHKMYLLDQAYKRPTAHIMPKHPYLYTQFFPFPGAALPSAQVATANH